MLKLKLKKSFLPGCIAALILSTTHIASVADTIKDSLLLRYGAAASVNTYLVSTSNGNAFDRSTDWNPGGWGTTEALLTGDFNGDGATDILLRYRDGSDTPGINRYLVALSDGSKFVSAGDWNPGSWGSSPDFIVGDFNGDGKSDILARYPDSRFSNGVNQYMVALSDASKFVAAGDWNPGGWGTSEILLTGDFNGDGKTDILVGYQDSTGYRYLVALSTGTGFVYAGDWNPGGWGGTGTVLLTGDFNGDGKTDILWRYQDSRDAGGAYRYMVAFSDGSKFVSMGDWNPGGWGGSKDLITGDFNGDGKSDFLARYRDSSDAAGIFRYVVALSDGNKFVSAGNWASGWGDTEKILAGRFVQIDSQGFSPAVISAEHAAQIAKNSFVGTSVERETILPNQRTHALMRDIASIQRVENVARGITYSVGDYSVTNGKFTINASSTIPLLPFDWTHQVPPGCIYCKDQYGVDSIRYGLDYFQNQLQVTYTPQALAQRSSTADQLPRMNQLMNARSSLKITFVGDSITVGRDSSRVLGLAPSQDGWADLVSGYLHSKNPYVRVRNVAVGGTDANFATNPANVNLAPYTDVLVVAYGMNDQSGMRAPSDFRQSLEIIVNSALQANPLLEVVLVSSFRPLPESFVAKSTYYLDGYRAEMMKYASMLTARGNKAIVVDVTSEIDSVISRKRFVDITSNGVNHPNDFGHMLYAQTVLRRLGWSQ